MNLEEIEILNGGNMNSPKRIGDKVHRKANESTATIHKLLNHVRAKGINWVPIPYGINDDEEIISFIPGEVPHAMPGWIWNDEVIECVAKAQRSWHDATEDFEYLNEIWQFNSKTKIEVICHNDFAPYNIVFENQKFNGVIDFDLCSPGSRLWDIAYTLYRFVPVMPFEKIEPNDEVSPFDIGNMMRRIELFVQNYSNGQKEYSYSKNEILAMIGERLDSIAEWTENFANETNNEKLLENSRMYRRHSVWVNELNKTTAG
jgi:thiamine kinase-like enzyme